ncbi:hypothetical protein DAEQUDRAFT_734060 [Daedalea quercina L-15889]|uniref:Uncharacterized protein n=1 Tax=Daedalea quercina L-15889 TaxID=1314783 RepID=A0A165KJW5_9APHY|nr:hypothetical protein DAEQUDRAFT_734060 [Daedalea quercina L-15889]
MKLRISIMVVAGSQRDAACAGVELRLFWVLHDRIGLILTCYGLMFYVATYYIHSLQT